MGNVEPEQYQQSHHHHYRDAEAALKERPWRADPGNHGRGEQQPAGETAEVGHVVDVQARVDEEVATTDGQAKHKVQRGKVDDRFAQPFEFRWRHGEAIRLQQYNQRSGDAEDCARCARSGRKENPSGPVADRPKPVDVGGEQVPGRAGENVHRQHARRTHQRLGQQAQVPQAPHVGGQVQNSHVHKHGGDNPPPLAVDQHRSRRCSAPQCINWSVVGLPMLTPCTAMARNTAQLMPTSR